MIEVDVVIVGSGMVGLTAACALAQTPLTLMVVDDKKLPRPLSADPCLRASAINSGSEAYFSHLNIWDKLLASKRVLTLQRIEAREKQGTAFFKLDSNDHSYANLGHIIENDLIINQLYEQLGSSSQVQYSASHVKKITITDQNAQVYLHNNEMVKTKLIIAADGANSWVRQAMQINLWQYRYRHHALVARVKTAKEHNQCARQLFYADGIVAFLPLWVADEHCVVWSVKPDQVERLQNNTTAAFDAALTAMSASWLGNCMLQSPIRSFPLRARYVLLPVRHRVIFIGDAAHTIHPLAGQGVNLGLRDVADLIGCLRQLHQQGKDIGRKHHFSGYQLRRNRDVLSMLVSMQTIESCFDGQLTIKKWLRRTGMNVINHSPRLKQYLLNYALGL